MSADTRTVGSGATASAVESAHYEQDELWEHQDVLGDSTYRPRLDAAAAFVPDPSASILEVGAGDGRGLHHLIAAGHDPRRLIALDRSGTALRRSGLTAVQGSADELPVASRGLDGVICAEVLEHLPAPVYDRARAELERVADDWLIVSVPNRERRHRADITCSDCGCRYNADRHLRSFAPEDLPGLFERFQVEAVVEVGPHQPVYPRRARLAMERRGLLVRPGSPSCPQCGKRYEFSAGAAHDDQPPAGEQPPADRRAGASSNDGHTRRSPGTGVASTAPSRTSALRSGVYRAGRRFLPQAKHPYHLVAFFRRVG